MQQRLPDQISESKSIFDNPVQELPDTTINVSVQGEVYILDNESFENGEWENAVGRSHTLGYVEYWVILKDESGKAFLYSRFTIGAFDETALWKAEEKDILAISPWGLALKALENAALDACLQSIIIRIIDKDVKSWSESWDKVSYLGAVWEGVSSLIPWKKSLAIKLLQYATRAFVGVIDNALKYDDYTVEKGIRDFGISFAVSGFQELLFHPKVIETLGKGTTFARVTFAQGLDRVYSQTTSGVLKKIIFLAGKYFDDFTNGIVNSAKYIENNTFISGVKKIDLMGGQQSKLGNEFVNIDFSEKIITGIKGDATKLSKFIPLNSVDELVCSNPYLGTGFIAEDYFKEVSKIIKIGKNLF